MKLCTECITNCTYTINNCNDKSSYANEQARICADVCRAAAAAHYEKEALDESTHYSIIRNYFADWGVDIPFFAIPTPPKFESIQDIIEANMELNTRLVKRMKMIVWQYSRCAK